MTRSDSYGEIREPTVQASRRVPWAVLLPLAWAAAAVGYYGPWIGHEASALVLTGGDMAEFVKFLPEVRDGSLAVMRQYFYLPPAAVVMGVALLVGSRRIGFPSLLRALLLLLAIPVSLQLLPPAWSPASLTTAEFLPQTVALGVLWLSLATFWLWGRVPALLTGLASSALAFGAAGLGTWQFIVVKPAIDAVYGSAPGVGWGLFVCVAGLVAMGTLGALLPLGTRRRRRQRWSRAT